MEPPLAPPPSLVVRNGLIAHPAALAGRMFDALSPDEVLALMPEDAA